MVVEYPADDPDDRLFQALADPTRRDILRRCADGEPSVSRLAGLPDELRRRAEARGGTRARRAGHEDAPGREQLVRGDMTPSRGRAGLDQLEATWRGRVDRMAEILARDPTNNERNAMTVRNVEKDPDA